MSLLDWAADRIREVLVFLPPRVVAYVWFPVLVTVVFLGALLFVRHLLPPIGRCGAASLRFLASLVAAALLAPDMAVATLFRRVRDRPPAVLYHYGDAVATATINVAGASGAIASGLARLARINVYLVVVGCAVVIWTWNHSHCPAGTAEAACVRPFTSWVDDLGREYPTTQSP